MSSRVMHLRGVVMIGVAVGLAAAQSAGAPATPPRVGEMAPNFSLPTLEDVAVELKPLTQQAPVVLVVLRGWPGYQCPMCARQVHDFVSHAARFAERNARVVMVYPGSAETLKAHARAFLQDKNWPASFTLVLDAGFEFTNSYGLRWDAHKESAYPATFVIERGGRIRFAHVSQTHGNRLSAVRAAAELP